MHERSADIGLYRLGSLGDYAWLDYNGNGVQEDTETGIENVTVTLTKPDGTTEVTTTDVNGFYQFINLIPGEYDLKFVAPDNTYKITEQNKVSDDEKDSDISKIDGTIENYILYSGENIDTLDAGFNQLVNIGDFVWWDVDENGRYDDHEDPAPGSDHSSYSS